MLQGVTDYYPIEDIYHEYRYRRRTDEELRKYDLHLRAEGNVPKGGGAFTPRYVVLIDGTKIVPFNESIQLNQLGDMITDNPDVDATLYDLTSLTVPKAIFIKPSEAEVIQLNSAQIEFSSFQNGIAIDLSNHTGKAVTGTVFPAGTLQAPCNNLTDAAILLDDRGFSQVYVLGDATIDDTTNWFDTSFIGESPLKTTINILPIAQAQNCEFYDATVTGTLDGNSQIERCVIDDLDFVDGYVYRCALGPGTITLGTSTIANIFSCYSTVPGTATPEIDMNGTGILALRDYNGGMLLKNYNGNGSHSIDLASGQIKLDNTITSGTFVVRGVGKLVDTSGNHILSGTWNGGVTIVNELLFRDYITDSVWSKTLP